MTTFSKKIVGREKEKELLKELVDSKKAEFIAIYGRRRVGKTYLITNLLGELPGIFFNTTGIQDGTLAEQLEEFYKQLGITFYQGVSVSRRKRWRDAFEDLTQAMAKAPKDLKIILFFDEFPWMFTRRSKLLRVLEL